MKVDLTFYQRPAWLAARCVPPKGDVRFQVWNDTRSAIKRLLCDTLEEKVECFDEPLLGSGGRGSNHPSEVTVDRDREVSDE